MKKRMLFSIGFIALVTQGCGPKRANYRNYLDHFPKSVLVLPPLNESLEVQASGMFLSTISTPLAERGYYVIPVGLVDAVLKENGVPLPPEMHQVSIAKLREVFGADAVLYVTISRWTTTYLVLDCTTTVVLDYRLVDSESSLELWRWQQAFQYSPSREQNNIVGKVVAAGVHAARSSSGRVEREVAVAANQTAFCAPQHGLLCGHRHPNHIKETELARRQQQKFEEKQARIEARANKRS